MQPNMQAAHLISEDAAAVGDSSIDLRAGESLTLKDLICGALVRSGNDACYAIAEIIAGSEPFFVHMMNMKAAVLGAFSVHAANTNGLPDDTHVISAEDLALLGSLGLKKELFAETVSAKYVQIGEGSSLRHYQNTNKLLWQDDNIIGIKTGTTTEAGYCLASAAELDGRTLYCVVLGAELVKQPDQSYRRMNFVESTRLLEWGFNNFSYRTIWESSEPVKQLPVTLSETDHVLVRSEGSISALLPKDVDPDDFTQTVTLYTDSVEAPVTKGQVLGEITLSYEGRDYGTLDLVALNDVERSELMYRIDRVEQFIAQPWFKFAVIGVVAFVLFLIILITALTRKKRRRARSYSGYSGRRRR